MPADEQFRSRRPGGSPRGPVPGLPGPAGPHQRAAGAFQHAQQHLPGPHAGHRSPGGRGGVLSPADVPDRAGDRAWAPAARSWSGRPGARKKPELVRRVAGTTLAGAAVLGVAVMALGWLAIAPVLEGLRTPPEVLPQAVAYARVMLLALPVAVPVAAVGGAAARRGRQHHAAAHAGRSPPRSACCSRPPSSAAGWGCRGWAWPARRGRCWPATWPAWAGWPGTSRGAAMCWPGRPWPGTSPSTAPCCGR